MAIGHHKYDITVDGQIYKVVYDRRYYGRNPFTQKRVIYTWVKVIGQPINDTITPDFQWCPFHSLPGDPYPQAYFPVGPIREGIRQMLADGIALTSRPQTVL